MAGLPLKIPADVVPRLDAMAGHLQCGRGALARALVLNGLEALDHCHIHQRCNPMNAAISYIEGLQLKPSDWQVYESWESHGCGYAVLAIWDNAGHEQQQLIEVGPHGVRWIPLRIFRSPAGRSSDRRGACLWFNPAEIEADAITEHNRAALEAAAQGVG